MQSGYAAIRADNERRYGTDIGLTGPMLLANRYADRTHFIFELLQNAEDALARRAGWLGSRAVTFELTSHMLRVSHFGKPFDEPDVIGICGIARSTKNLTEIGRFGIGFKSVFAFTDRPEIHSGTEDFAIESFVWPVAAPPVVRAADETVILIPLRPEDDKAYDEIAAGLERLGASTLLFLREIEEIHWDVEGGQSGRYLREPKDIVPGVRRVTLVGQEGVDNDTGESWMVFSRAVAASDGHHIGYVEIAFFTKRDGQRQCDVIQRVDRSSLVVFFPTVLETHLGFLLQGPYRTTPSRDNVPCSDSWNQRLVSETTSLLLDALRWLRDHDLLSTAALRCLPLEPAKFTQASMFAPIFAATKQALISERLLPTFHGGYVDAIRGRLARTQELRELFTPAQLAALYEKRDELLWLSGDITQDRTPEVRRYLMQELGMTEFTPELVIPRLNRSFLEVQSDDWIVQLYSFLNEQSALRPRFTTLPLVRLEDGTHVVASVNGQPQAFLPGEIRTGFPTVRSSVCATGTARKFLKSLDLTEPDLVDDVIRNLLPKYQQKEISISDTEYEADIKRILTAFNTDSKAQREKLVTALQHVKFVMAVDAGNNSKWFTTPKSVYLATERLRELFTGVAGVLLVHDDYACLRGEKIRELLEACGATRYLQPQESAATLDSQQLRKLRVAAGCESWSSTGPIQDQTLRGLVELLAVLPQLVSDTRRKKAALLWEAIAEVQERRGSSIFSGTYSWYYYYRRSATFDAAFVRQLNETAWVPDTNGDLQRPEFVLFDTLGWKPNPFLLSKIHFKRPVIEALAREVGIEPGVLDLLKKLGVTSEADLRTRLGISKEQAPMADGSGVEDVLKKLFGNAPAPMPPVPDLGGTEPCGSTVQGGGNGAHGGIGTGCGSGHAGGASGGQGATGTKSSAPVSGKRSPGSAGGRPFISYVAVSSDEEEPDPDGLAQQARMDLEDKAIKLILSRDPRLQRTPTNNRGFDLFEPDSSGQPVRWVEVKAMTGLLADRPVCLSRAQFDCAWIHGEAYWLYIVERAGESADLARVLRIQDPSGKARNFAFDQGWRQIADLAWQSGAVEKTS